MFRLIGVLATLFVMLLIKYARRMAGPIEGLVSVYPAEVANPIFIGFGIAVGCIAVYTIARYRFRRISLTDWKGVIVLLIETVVVPVLANAVWCWHLYQTIMIEAYKYYGAYYNPFTLLLLVELPAYVLIAAGWINWCSGCKLSHRVARTKPESVEQMPVLRVEGSPTISDNVQQTA